MPIIKNCHFCVHYISPTCLSFYSPFKTMEWKLWVSGNPKCWRRLKNVIDLIKGCAGRNSLQWSTTSWHGAWQGGANKDKVPLWKTNQIICSEKKDSDFTCWSSGVLWGLSVLFHMTTKSKTQGFSRFNLLKYEKQGWIDLVDDAFFEFVLFINWSIIFNLVGDCLIIVLKGFNWLICFNANRVALQRGWRGLQNFTVWKVQVKTPPTK